MISQGEVAAVFFFTDPLSAHPHHADIEALNRICCVHDCMFANNPSTATAMIYAIEFSAVGFSRLIGENPDQRTDSVVVKKYKADQQKVIAEVQGKRLSLKDVFGSNKSMRRLQSLTRGSIGSMSTSVLYAPGTTDEEENGVKKRSREEEIFSRADSKKKFCL